MGVGKKTAAVRQKYRNGTIDKIIKNNRGGKIKKISIVLHKYNKAVLISSLLVLFYYFINISIVEL